MNFNDNKTLSGTAKLNSTAGATANSDNRRAIILAGASGFQSGGSVQADFRGQCPAHFSRKSGCEILINRTRKQLEKVFSPQETMVLVSEGHSDYYTDILSDVSGENLFVQPLDDGTTVAVLFAALRLAMTNPSAVLAFFRADFYAPDADAFMRSVESACAFARRDPNLILLGISPGDAEIKDEWIEIDSSAPVDKRFGVWRVRRFSTRASPERMRQMESRGALLNGSVMVGTVATFLRKIRRAAPEIYERFSLAAERMGTGSEQRAVRAAYYSQSEYTDFSRDVLEKNAEKLLVIPVPASLRNAVGIEPLPAAAASLPEAFVNSAPKFYTARAGAYLRNG